MKADCQNGVICGIFGVLCSDYLHTTTLIFFYNGFLHVVGIFKLTQFDHFAKGMGFAWATAILR